MILNTAFRYTPYRDMHLGHAFCAWFPSHFAQAVGGSFTVIPSYAGFRLHELDSNSYSWERATARFSEDLLWLGYEHTVLDTQALWDTYVEQAERLGYKMPRHDFESYGWHIERQQKAMSTFDGCIFDPWVVIASCIDYETARADAMWRGLDRLASAQIYADMAVRLGFRPPAQQFVPTVWREGATCKQSKSEIGGTNVRDLREAGYTPRQVTDTLRELHRRWTLIPQWQRTPHIVIPENMLTPQKVVALEYEGEWCRAADNAKGTAWEADAKDYGERVLKERAA